MSGNAITCLKCNLIENNVLYFQFYASLCQSDLLDFKSRLAVRVCDFTSKLHLPTSG